MDDRVALLSLTEQRRLRNYMRRIEANARGAVQRLSGAEDYESVEDYLDEIHQLLHKAQGLLSYLAK